MSSIDDFKFRDEHAQSNPGPNRTRSTLAADGRRNPFLPPPPGCGGHPTYDWPKTLGLVAVGAVLSRRMGRCRPRIRRHPRLLIVLGGGVVLLERLFPNADVLGDDETKQERLACHLLHQPLEPPIKRPVRKCSRHGCTTPVFLSGLCASHYEMFADIAYDASWEPKDLY